MPTDDYVHINRPERTPIVAHLTARELEICRLIAAGCSTRQTATELSISPKTVEFHLGRAYRKLAVNNRAQLTQAIITAAHTALH